MEHILTLKRYVSEKKDIPIEYFNTEFLQGKRILDPWQRLDGWNQDYKTSFIKSILQGNDIPKIMQYTLKEDSTQKQRILDGGHISMGILELRLIIIIIGGKYLEIKKIMSVKLLLEKM